MKRASLSSAPIVVYGALTLPADSDSPRYRAFFAGLPVYFDAHSKQAAFDAAERWRAEEIERERARVARAEAASERAKARGGVRAPADA